MREFIVATRRSQPLPETVAKRLTGPDVPGSLFRAADCQCRSLHSGHTLSVFRYLVKSPRATPDRFFDGLAVANGQLVADELPPKARSTPQGFVESSRGVFAFVSIDGDEVHLFSDPLSVYPIWLWQDADLAVFSNNTHLIRHTVELLGIPVKKNPLYFGWQLIFNNGVADSTGYQGIRWMPFGHYATIAANADGPLAATFPLSVSSPDALFNSDSDYSTLMDMACQEIEENIVALCSGDFRGRLCDLTGGHDSRVMVAAVLRRGLAGRFAFSTGGSPKTTDGKVASLIRRELGLRKGSIVSRPWHPPPDILTSLRRVLFRTYGCFAQVTDIGLGRKSDRSILHLIGGCGETFRSVYLSQLSSSTPTTVDLLIRQVRLRGETLRPEAVDRLTSTLADLFEKKKLQGFSSLDAGDQYYIEHRNRQFMGTECRARLNFESAAYPLYSPAAIMAAFSIPAEDRGRGRTTFELIDRLCPSLLAFPLAEAQWDPELYKGHKNAERLHMLEAVTSSTPYLAPEQPENDIVEVIAHTYPYEGHATSQQQPPSKWMQGMKAEGKHWTWVHLESAHELFRELVTEGELLDAMQDVFDLDALRSLASRDLGSFSGSTEIRLIYRLLAAMLWLGDRELETPLIA